MERIAASLRAFLAAEEAGNELPLGAAAGD
jgi:hypothetical protein